jgi:hypothetical protein
MTYTQGSDDWKHGDLPYYQKDYLGIKEVGVYGENYRIIVDEFTGLARIEKVEDKDNARK